MKRKLLVATLFVVLVCLMIPVVANAATHDVPNGDTFDLSDGTAVSGDIITIQGGFTATLTGTAPDNVVVVCLSGAKVTLDNVVLNCTTANTCAMSYDSLGFDFTITLVGTNSLTSGENRPGLEILNGQTTIQGTGSLTANGGNNAAGIGMGNAGSGIGMLIISEGTITANAGDNAAGIGTGPMGAGNVITINGGTVTANGGINGAGIGGGNLQPNEPVRINGGIVYANGGDNGAGIGAGNGGAFAPITINGGEVYASAGSGGAHDIGCGAGSTTGALSRVADAATLFLENEAGGSFGFRTPTPDYVTYSSSSDVPAAYSVPAGWVYPIGMYGQAIIAPEPDPDPAPVASTPTPGKVDNPQTGYGESSSNTWMILLVGALVVTLGVVRKRIVKAK